MGIVGVGIDIVEIARMRAVLERTPRFATRAFTAAEQAYCRAKKDPTERFAARFAAKEAVLKVLDDSILRIPLTAIEVVRAESGKPSLLLTGTAEAKAGALGITAWELSITHTESSAQALAVGVDVATSLPDAQTVVVSAMYGGLARKRAAAGALLFDPAGRLLVVRPTYKPGWTIPGGAVEAGESPRHGAERELREELGLELGLDRLVVVDWAPAVGGRGEAMHFLFTRPPLTVEQAAAVVLPPEELADHAWLAPAEALGRLQPPALARRVAAALDTPPGEVRYLDAGAMPGA